MSFIVTLVITLLASCSAENITAYVKETLTKASCQTVIADSSICNVRWRVSHTAADEYDRNIKGIKDQVSSNGIVSGLTPSEAINCRKAYQAMLCGTYFPVCDSKTLTVDYGDGASRCDDVNKACKNIYVDGCSNGKSSLVKEEQNCVPLVEDTSKFCPNFSLTIPQSSTSYIGGVIKRLSWTAESFDQKTKNVTGMESCTNNYKEVLCRMITACSPNEYYSLFLMGKKACEEKMSCAKNYDPELKVDTSMCTLLPDIDDRYAKVTVMNPFHRPTAPTGEPKTTEPKATEQKATEPKATEQKVTEQKVTEPKAPEPKITEQGTKTSSSEADKEIPAPTHIPENDGDKTEPSEEVSSYPTNSTLNEIPSKKVAHSGKGSAGNIRVNFVWFTLFTTLPFLHCYIPW